MRAAAGLFPFRACGQVLHVPLLPMIALACTLTIAASSTDGQCKLSAPSDELDTCRSQSCCVGNLAQHIAKPMADPRRGCYQVLSPHAADDDGWFRNVSSYRVGVAEGLRLQCRDGFAAADQSQQEEAAICREGSWKALDGMLPCVDVDECALQTDTCHPMAACNNTEGSYTCLCKAGYAGCGDAVGGCEDVNECDLGTHNCHPHTTCVNTIGSFTCECKPSDGPLDVLDMSISENSMCANVSNGWQCWGGGALPGITQGNVAPDQGSAVRMQGVHVSVRKDVLACVVRCDGNIACDGKGIAGSLGNGQFQQSHSLNPPLVGVQDGTPLSGAQKVVTMLQTGCALLFNGEVWCWGRNNKGQLGQGNTLDLNYAKQVSLPESIVDLKGTWQFVCALSSVNVLYCWGENHKGQTSGTSNPQKTPRQAASGGINAFAPGAIHTCILQNGEMKCIGEGARFGKSGNRRSFETVNMPSGAGTPVQLSGGRDITCVLTSNHAVVCMGSNSRYDMLDTGDSGATNPKILQSLPPITVQTLWADGWNVCLFGNHSLWCNGANMNNMLLGMGNGSSTLRTLEFPSGTTITQAWGQHICGISSQGIVQCVGRNNHGYLGDGTTVGRNQAVTVLGAVSGKTIVEVSSSSNANVAVDSTGAAYSWGRNHRGQLGNSNTNDKHTAVTVANSASGVAKVSMGTNFGCLLSTSGQVKCWGRNQKGQLGIGNKNPKTSPTTVSNLAAASAVSCGNSFACAIVTNSPPTVKCWGQYEGQRLGQEYSSDQTSPRDVPGVTNATEICAGSNHACALIGGGTVMCWGSGEWGQTGLNTSMESAAAEVILGDHSHQKFTSVSCSDARTCALSDRGDVYCWGRNLNGALGIEWGEIAYVPMKATRFGKSDSVVVGEQQVCSRGIADGLWRCLGSAEYIGSWIAGSGPFHKMDLSVL